MLVVGLSHGGSWDSSRARGGLRRQLLVGVVVEFWETMVRRDSSRWDCMIAFRTPCRRESMREWSVVDPRILNRVKQCAIGVFDD